MLLFDKERTLISLNNVTHVNSRISENKYPSQDFVLTVWYVGGGGFGYNYVDEKTMTEDKKAIEKWLGKKEHNLKVHWEKHPCGDFQPIFTDARGTQYAGAPYKTHMPEITGNEK